MADQFKAMGAWLRGSELGELGRSFGEHPRRVPAPTGWALIVSGVGGVLGLISATVEPSNTTHPTALVPTWLWMVLLFGGVIVAQFLAFHDVRKERDAVKREMAERFSNIRYRFAMVGLRERWDVSG